jgi:hypothetical protein
VKQTSIFRKTATTSGTLHLRMRAGHIGDGCDELERGRALPRCLKKKHDTDLQFFYVSHTGVQLKSSEGRMEHEQPIAAYGDRTLKFSANSSAADIPADSRKKLSVDDKVNAEACFQARLPILEVPETIQIAHFELPIRIAAGPQYSAPPTYRLELSCFHSRRGCTE